MFICLLTHTENVSLHVSHGECFTTYLKWLKEEIFVFRNPYCIRISVIPDVVPFADTVVVGDGVVELELLSDCAVVVFGPPDGIVALDPLPLQAVLLLDGGMI